MFSWRNKKTINTFWLKEVPYLELCFQKNAGSCLENSQYAGFAAFYSLANLIIDIYKLRMYVLYYVSASTDQRKDENPLSREC